MTPELSPQECRVLGALIEKHMTTPDHYPLTTSSLRTACNQVSNRDPVVEYDEATVIDAVNGLRAKSLARTVKRAGERAVKHLETADEGLDIDRRQKALLAVMLLRGPQTSGELRARTERYLDFADTAEVEAVLRSMEEADIPVARLQGRRPGQKEPRYRHLLVDEESDDELLLESETGDAAGRLTERGDAGDLRELALLREEVAELRRDVDRLKAILDG